MMGQEIKEQALRPPPTSGFFSQGAVLGPFNFGAAIRERVPRPTNSTLTWPLSLFPHHLPQLMFRRELPAPKGQEGRGF